MGDKMNTNEIIELAKRGAISHDQVYSELVRFAEEQRQRGQSSDQAFSHFVSKTAEGQRLFAAYRDMPGSPFDMNSPAHKPATQQPVAKADDGVAWGDLVKAYARSYNLSEAKAIDQLLLTEGGSALFKKQMRAERLRTGAYSEMDMQYLDACDKQADEHRDMHKRVKVSLFEQMVADLREKHPHMALSDAQDFVRSTPEGKTAWEEWKKLGVPADPTQAPISGKPAPRHETMWDSPASGSRQSAGRDVRPAAPADDTPRFKSAAAAVAESNFGFFVKILFDASARAGKPWSIEKCISTLRACPSAAQYFNAAVAG
jgi:hypothetical protein